MLNFLKLGGSLITDKTKAKTPKRGTLSRLADEIATAREDNPNLQLIIGHGSGSFGHVVAKKYGTRAGVRTAEQWHGFIEVWKEARNLNQIIIESLLKADLPILSIPPSAVITTINREIQNWNIQPIKSALNKNLIPLIYGDVVFDEQLGGTIVSTEELFHHLALQLQPRRILLAGLDTGVWADYPTCTRLIKVITPTSYNQITHQLGGSVSTDVTGGMALKVKTMVDLVAKIPDLWVLIFSGDKPGILQQALQGISQGTVICE